LENDFSSLISQKVFDITAIDISTMDQRLIIPSRVIFDIRMNAHGSTNKYKTRLVATIKTAPLTLKHLRTVSARTIILYIIYYILLGVAASKKLEISTIDVKSTFLYSLIKEIIYLKRPQGLSPNIIPNIVK